MWGGQYIYKGIGGYSKYPESLTLFEYLMKPLLIAYNK